jgi:maltose O-acetyltransferase
MMKNRLIQKIIRRIRGEPDVNKLIKLGMKVGKNFCLQPQCMIDESFCWLIKIGDNVTFAPGVKVFTHDASSQHHIHYTRVGRVEIGDNTFIGAGSIILPNVTIGSNCIIGAGSVV